MENFLSLFCFAIPFFMVSFVVAVVVARWVRREIIFGKKTVNAGYWGGYKTAPSRAEANLFYLPKPRRAKDVFADNAPHTMHY